MEPTTLLQSPQAKATLKKIFNNLREHGAAGAAESRRFGESREARPYFEAMQVRCADALTGSTLVTGLDRSLILQVNRPSPMFHAQRYSQQLGGAQILLKREDLMAPGTELLAAVTGQVMLAAKLGFKEVVTGSEQGQKGVIMASIAARLGLKAVIFKDGEDTHAEAASVFRMWVCGADVEILDPNTRNQDARVAALRYCLKQSDERFLVMGLESAPDPYPAITQGLVGVVGREAAFQVRSQFKRLPDLVVARGQTATDAFGLFQPFLSGEARLVCVNAGSDLGGSSTRAKSEPTDEFSRARARALRQQRRAKASGPEHPDYPSLMREHALLQQSGRVEYVDGDAAQARRAIRDLSRQEGLIPAISTAHVLGWAAEAAREMSPEQVVLVSMAERVQEDIWDIGQAFGMSSAD